MADIRYRDLASAAGEGRFISTGEAAFVVTRGRAYQLPGRETRWLRAGGDDPLFEDFDLQRWMEDPEAEPGEGLDEADLERTTGPVDVLEAAYDLSSLSARLGRPVLLEPLMGTEPRRLQESTELARAEVISGVDDRLLRRLLLEVEMKNDDHPFAGMFADLAAGSFTFDLSISEPDRKVEVEPPPSPLPFDELPQADRRRGVWP